MFQHYRKLIVAILSLVIVLSLSGFQVATTNGGTPIDIGSSVTTVGQYALLAWLIVRSETRITDQQKAWREERKWLMEMVFKLMGVKLSE